MPSAISGGARIRTNTPAENAYSSLTTANNQIALRQLRLSTGKRINSAADDVAGYITSRSLSSRTGSLRSALNATGDAKNVAAISQDGLDNISKLLTQIKDTVSTAASGALGTDEKVALAQAAYSLTNQIQTVVDSTSFGGKDLIKGSFSGDFVIGFRSDNTLLTLAIDLTTATAINNGSGVDLSSSSASFAGVSGLSLASFNSISSSNLGLFSSANISATLTSLATALNNVNKFASYIGGVYNRLESQEESLLSQITNYNTAISRIEDTDVAQEQLQLTRAQFLQQTSVVSLAQANQSPQNFLQLLR